MKSRKIFSPYYDFKNFQCNPYLKTPTGREASARKKVATAEEKSLHQSGRRSFDENLKQSSSCEILKREKIHCREGSGDYCAEKEIEGVEDFSDYQQLNFASKFCQVNFVKRQIVGPQRVPSYNFHHHLLNKKWVYWNSIAQILLRLIPRTHENQSALRYLLKMSDKTFHATLKHEIDVLKKEKQSHQDELNLHSQSILKILKSQSEDKESLKKSLWVEVAANFQMVKLEFTFSQLSRNKIKKLEDDSEQKESALITLQKEVNELKWVEWCWGGASSDEFFTFRFHLERSLNLAEEDLEALLKRIMENRKKTKTELRKRPKSNDVKAKSLPSSAPSMIPQRLKPKDQARVASEPGIIISHKGSGDAVQLFVKESNVGSEFGTNFSSHCSDLLSDLNISCSKISVENSSSMRTNMRTVGTNYSANDFSEFLVA